MDLFTYLMAKNDHNTSVNNDLFSYLLGKGQSGNYQTFTGTSIIANNTKKGKMKLSLKGNTSQSGEPTPDAPIPVNVVSGDNEVVVCGKNLLNFSLPFSIAGETNKFLNYVPKLEIGENYYFVGKTSDGIKIFGYQCVCVWYNTNTSSSIKTQVVNETFTGFDTSGANNFYVYFGGSLAGKTVSEFMLVKGTYDSSNIPDYEPYQSQDAPLTLGDKEICKIGNYEDKIFKAIKGNEIYDSLASEEKATLDYGKWYLRKAIKKIVFNGTENWGAPAEAGGTFYRFECSNFRNNDCLIHSEYLCDKFRYNGTNGQVPQYVITNTSSTGLNRLWLTIDTTLMSGTTANDFKTWLSSNNTTVYYVLATPTNEKFNDTIQDQLEDIYNNMLSYEGQTNISQVNNDLPFNIEANIKVGK